MKGRLEGFFMDAVKEFRKAKREVLKSLSGL